jgi:hypothetical protein
VTETLEAKMARIAARIAANREKCPACEAREERAAILEFDACLPREEAERRAREMHPCKHA